MNQLLKKLKGAKKRFIAHTAKGTFLSLVLTTCAAFTACTEKEDFNLNANNKLLVNFAVNGHNSRTINRETSLPDGCRIGAYLAGYAGYENLVYTASTGKTPQTWTSDKDVVLSDASGIFYAYYPYSNSVSITEIPVDMTAEDQIDWLYGTPVSDINDTKKDVNVTMNHALANICVNVVRDTYVHEGNVTSISVQSDGIARKGIFNAAQAIPGYKSVSEKNELLERNVSTTLDATATDIMVVPTGEESAITFKVTVDGVVYIAKSNNVLLEMGNSYMYTLTLNSTFMAVSAVAVTPWNNVAKDDNLVMEEYDLSMDHLKLTYNVESTTAATELMNSSFNLAEISDMIIDGESVTPVKSYTFSSTGEHTVYIKYMDMKTIKSRAFYFCRNLTSVSIPNMVETIENDAFYYCDKLVKIKSLATIAPTIKSSTFTSVGYSGVLEVPQNSDYSTWMSTSSGYLGYRNWYCVEIDNYSFENNVYYSKDGKTVICCNINLSGGITIKEGVTTISDRAFAEYKGLTSITLPNSVTTIGKQAFYRSRNLSEITIVSGVQTIGEQAFNGCSGLTSIYSLAVIAPTFTSSNTFFDVKTGGTLYIPTGANGYDKWMSTTSYYLGALMWQCLEEGNYVLENGIYYSADGLSVLGNDGTITGQITIKDGVKTIKPGAFGECFELTGINIPNSVTEIGEYAFSDCTALTNVSIPSSVQTIKYGAFQRSGLTQLNLEEGLKEIKSHAFWYCEDLTTVVIPNSVTRIEACVFQGCEALTEATIGSGITYRLESVFSGCKNLEKITSFMLKAPETWSGTFSGVKTNGKLYVPVGATGYDIWMGYLSGWTMKEITEPEIFTFTLASRTYQAEEGMTWEQWVNSSYNTGNYYLKEEGGYVIIKTNELTVTINGVAELEDDIISASNNYQLNTIFELPSSEW